MAKAKPAGSSEGIQSQRLLDLLSAKGARPAGYRNSKEVLLTYLREALDLSIDENIILSATVDAVYVGCAIYELAQANGGTDWVKDQMEQIANQVIDNVGRSFIVVQPGKTDVTWRLTQDVLIKHNSPIYFYHENLVQPLWRWE